MRTLHLTYFSLLFFLLLTVGLSYLQLSLVWSEAVALGVAWIKALFVAIIFMRLKDESPTLRFVAFAGLFWVAFLACIISSDYLTRHQIGVLGK